MPAACQRGLRAEVERALEEGHAVLLLLRSGIDLRQPTRPRPGRRRRPAVGRRSLCGRRPADRSLASARRARTEPGRQPALAGRITARSHAHARRLQVHVRARDARRSGDQRLLDLLDALGAGDASSSITPSTTPCCATHAAHAEAAAAEVSTVGADDAISSALLTRATRTHVRTNHDSDLAAPGVTLRLATRDDVPLILAFIRELAEYEREPRRGPCRRGHARRQPVRRAARRGSGDRRSRRPARRLRPVLPQLLDLARPAAACTWKTCSCAREFRGHGVGQVLMAYLARLAVERDCGRFEWCGTGLEHAGDRFLPRPRRHRHGRMDRAAPHRRALQALAASFDAPRADWGAADSTRQRDSRTCHRTPSPAAWTQLAWHPERIHGPHPRRLHRRPARALRHRRGDRRARAAEAPGQGIFGALPVPRRALADLHGVADQAVLPLLRLRRARHRDLVPDELRPARVPRCGRRTRQARRHGSAARHAAAQRQSATPATSTRAVDAAAKFFRKQLGGQRRRRRPTSTAATSSAAIREQFHDRLRARRLQRAARCARHRRAPDVRCSNAPACSRRTSAATSTTSSATG